MAEEEPSGLSHLEALYLGAAQAMYSISRALKLDKATSLLKRAELSLQAPIHLLGETYAPIRSDNPADDNVGNNHERLLALVKKFSRIVWMSYRSDFHPLSSGEKILRSDAGWGCTFRSFQMLLARTLQIHLLGGEWEWPMDETEGDLNGSGHHLQTHPNNDDVISLRRGSYYQESIMQINSILRLFWDLPCPQCPFSIHNICSAGSKSGIVPGRWLGPWVGCKAISAAADQVEKQLNLRVAVLASTGGGAPILYRDSKFRKWLTENHFYDQQSYAMPRNSKCQSYSSDNSNNMPEPCDKRTLNEEKSSCDVSCTVPAQDPYWMNDVSVDDDAKNRRKNCEISLQDIATPSQAGLLILVPLLLGIEKLNLQYIPQLCDTFQNPFTVGIVGGRPSSSLYFVGCQSNALLYLDPHVLQPAASSENDWSTFKGDTLRALPVANIDPSLALGFYCRNVEDFDSLCQHLEDLENAFASTPIISVRDGSEPGEEFYSTIDAAWADDDLDDAESFDGAPRHANQASMQGTISSLDSPIGVKQNDAQPTEKVKLQTGESDAQENINRGVQSSSLSNSEINVSVQFELDLSAASLHVSAADVVHQSPSIERCSTSTSSSVPAMFDIDSEHPRFDSAKISSVPVESSNGVEAKLDSLGIGNEYGTSKNEEKPTSPRLQATSVGYGMSWDDMPDIMAQRHLHQRNTDFKPLVEATENIENGDSFYPCSPEGNTPGKSVDDSILPTLQPSSSVRSQWELV